MNAKSNLEVWLRGPLPDLTPALQPVAHALLQAVEELSAIAPQFPASLLWEKPAGVASVGFHLQHLTGVLDRLFTYARQESLTESQMEYLKNEGIPQESISFHFLLQQFKNQVDMAINQLKQADETTLSEIRYVGRAMIPSTQLGLLFHAAEHTQRHLGQLLVTAKVLMAGEKI
ncbi:DinB family protein [Dyadobacter sp. Leaf189]|uniref:DinB family protein n=1 Tax=Dyadobacter sp. Leaf189 TaxID=1736295 RepID=UPI0006F2F816|nr:DinB family protein [Dyadobacter sp. Leaf189]KQS26940.1 metal-dependent hydrolase [Dyadobacter sp. Leaf189]